MHFTVHSCVIAVIAVIALVAPACAGDDSADSGNDAAGTADDGGTAAGTETGASGLTVTGTYSDFIDNMPVVGAIICVREQPDVECATTDDMGAFTLTGVAPGAVIVEMTHDNFPTHLGHWGDDVDWSIVQPALNDDATALIVQQAGGELDPALGNIAMQVFGPDGGGLAGVTAMLSPAEGLGPVYLNDANIPDPMATETSASGYYGWANVPPGQYTFTVSHPTMTCSNLHDPDGTAGTTLTVETDSIASSWAYRCQ